MCSHKWHYSCKHFRTMRKTVKWLAFTCGMLFIGLQLVPVPIKLDDRSSSLQPAHFSLPQTDRHVAEVLERSCGDCHSQATKWPWYSHVAPMSWLLSSHVKKGRAKLNFSAWASRKHSANERAEICDAVSDGSMPLRGYVFLHRSARLSDQDVDAICRWTDTQADPNYSSQMRGVRTSGGPSNRKTEE